MDLQKTIQNLKKLFSEISGGEYNIIVIDEDNGFVEISVKSRKMQLFFKVNKEGTCYISSSSMQMVEGQLQIVPNSINLTENQSVRYGIQNGNF